MRRRQRHRRGGTRRAAWPEGHPRRKIRKARRQHRLRPRLFPGLHKMAREGRYARCPRKRDRALPPRHRRRDRGGRSAHCGLRLRRFLRLAVHVRHGGEALQSREPRRRERARPDLRTRSARFPQPYPGQSALPGRRHRPRLGRHLRQVYDARRHPGREARRGDSDRHRREAPVRR